MQTLSLKTIGLALFLAATSGYAAASGAPFEQTQFDRNLPEVRQTIASQPASSGASAVSPAGRLASGPWTNDYHFIAPPQ